MVYDAKTKEVCHALTEDGQVAYQEMLDVEGDKLLVDAEHKVLAFIVRVCECLRLGGTIFQKRYDVLLDEMKQNRI